MGKTTLADALAGRLSGTLIHEDYAGNPFLAESYTGADSSRLPSQLYFLLSRVDQLWEATWPDSGWMICDYGFCQDAIYARNRLSVKDFAVYEKAAERLNALVHPPELVINLFAEIDTLLERVARRGRDYEAVFDEPFLRSMQEAYAGLVDHFDCPVLQIDCDRVDIRTDAAQQSILADVLEAVK